MPQDEPVSPLDPSTPEPHLPPPPPTKKALSYILSIALSIVLVIAAILVSRAFFMKDPDESDRSQSKDKVAARALTVAQLEPALLTQENLPDGYVIGETANRRLEQDAKPSELTGDAYCLSEESGALAELAPAGTTEVSRELSVGDEDPYATQTVVSFPRVSHATKAMNDLDVFANKCKSWVEEDPEIGRITYSLEEISYPTKGDATKAFRTTAKGEDLEFEILVVAFRMGNTACMVAFAPVDNTSRPIFDGIVADASQRLARIATNA